MSGLNPVGRLLIVAGVFLILLGGAIILFGRFGFSRLPGDILIERKNFTIYIPIVSSIILSLVLTLILSLVFRRW